MRPGSPSGSHPFKADQIPFYRQDAIDFYTEDIRILEAEIEKERQSFSK